MKLIITSGPNKGSVFDVSEETCTIGRAHANDIVLYDRRVSAHHAIIEHENSTPAVRDLGSANGTYVDGLLITRAALRPGCAIRVGDTVLAFEQPSLEDSDSQFRVVRDHDEETAIYATVDKEESAVFVEAPPPADDIESLREDRCKLLALYRVNSVINSLGETRTLLCRVLEEIIDVVGAERGFVILREPETGNLTQAATRLRRAEDQGSQVSISRAIARQVLDDGKAVLSTGPKHGAHSTSAMCAPLRAREAILGIIYVDGLGGTGSFSPRDLQLLTAMANQVGIALENAGFAEARLADERFAAIGQAVAGLSHYIKNILSCMQGGAQIVQRGLEQESTDTIGRGWGIVRRNERKISELVLDMLNYSGANEPLREPCNIDRLVEDIAEPLAEEAAKEVRVERDLAPDLPTAYLDPRAIHRCLLNLVSNAIDAVPETGGLVRLVSRFDPAERTVRLSVSDNGCGIDPELLPTIFDVFASTKGARGTGLGLAVVKKLVEEHGGRVEAQSTPGQGSTFTLVLPIHPPATGRATRA